MDSMVALCEVLRIFFLVNIEEEDMLPTLFPRLREYPATSRDPYNSFSDLMALLDADTTGGAPALDVEEDAERYYVTIDLPGIDKEDIDVSMEGRQLFISGKREEEREERGEGRKLLRRERRTGTFTRGLSLPEAAVDGDVDARFKNGTLEVSVPKSSESRGRRIEIS